MICESLQKRIEKVGGWKEVIDMIECQIGRKLMGAPTEELILEALEVLE